MTQSDEKELWHDYAAKSDFDDNAVGDLVEAYRARDIQAERAEDLDAALRFAQVILRLAGRGVATAWLRRQAELVRDGIPD